MKPNREFYLAVQHDLGIPSERIFFWDESPAHVAAAAAFLPLFDLSATTQTGGS